MRRHRFALTRDHRSIISLHCAYRPTGGPPGPPVSFSCAGGMLLPYPHAGNPSARLRSFAAPSTHNMLRTSRMRGDNSRLRAAEVALARLLPAFPTAQGLRLGVTAIIRQLPRRPLAGSAELAELLLQFIAVAPGIGGPGRGEGQNGAASILHGIASLEGPVFCHRGVARC